MSGKSDERKRGAETFGRRRLIGIDGGGTKTVCVVGDEHGRILAECRGEGSNIKSKPREEVERLIIGLIREAMALADQAAGIAAQPSRLEAVFLGLAGSDRPEDKERWLQVLSRELPDRPQITVTHDAIPALAAGTWGGGGIVLIAGTGSIAYGYDPANDRNVRVGGWGYLLGDEGSGFDLGRRGLTAIMRAFDGRSEPTMMTDMLLGKMRLSRPDQLINRFYGQSDVRAAIAGTARIVLAAAEQGDRVARGIVDEAVRELALLADTAATELGMAPPVPLVLSGGLFAAPFFRGQLERRLSAQSGRYRIVQLEVPPVIGSYLLALAGSGSGITEEVKRRIRRWTERKPSADEANGSRPADE